MGAPDSRGRDPGDARRDLLEGLIDHAALFPPASMSMADAVAEDRSARAGPHAWLIGRFVCPASRLGELGEEAGWERGPALSVVLDGAGAAGDEAWLGALRDDVRLTASAAAGGAPVEAVELAVPGERPASSLLVAALGALRPLRATTYLELKLGPGWRNDLPAAIGASSALGGRVKLRCGGQRAEAFPSVEQVALVIVACREAGALFKATAGLHGALHHTDPDSGFHMHGFLNLLAATAIAHAHGLRASALEPLLAEEDPAAFTLSAAGLSVGGHRVDARQAAAARARLFAGYGSCSWREPVEELTSLGVLGET